MKKNNLYLDDWRSPKHSYQYTGNQLYISEDWKIVRSYEEFINYIKTNGVPNQISFDHDLDTEHYKHQGVDLTEIYGTLKEMTGYHCAQWLIYHCIDNNLKLPEKVLIHSMSIEGAKNIRSLFDTYYKVNKISDYNRINDVNYDFNLKRYIYTYYN